MPGPLMLTFVSTLAFAFQFLIFAYLYATHRIRFFQYLLWAWGFFTLSKGLKLIEVAFSGASLVDPLMSAAGVAAQFWLLAGALAYRWDYRVRRRDVLGAAVLAVAVAALGEIPGGGVDLVVGTGLGLTQVGAALAFWPRPSAGVGYRGAGLLAAAFMMWGVHRIATKFMTIEPGSMPYYAIHGTFVFFYFLSTFAIIIMVLDRARSEMRSLKEFNERLVHGLREGLALVAGDFAVRYANPWMLKTFGPTGTRRCYERLTADGNPCPGCPLGRRHEMDGQWPVRLEVNGAGGRRLLLSCSPVRQPDGEVVLLELVADVTEPAQMRERLQQAERLAAAGTLAAGVAHEIRNPLAAIVNATTLLSARDSLTDEEHASTVSAVRTEARRLNRILSEFLLFARPRAPERRPGDIAEVVERVASLIREDRARAAGVELDLQMDRSIPAFRFDSDQMTQVLWNVALNGVEAMQGRGRLSLNVERVNGDVVISVADTGRGIAPEERARVFDPFYSGKSMGSGLGLTIAQGIVAAHGGRIELDSAPGLGTQVRIALPLGATST